jgi:hypothetical protein
MHFSFESSLNEFDEHYNFVLHIADLIRNLIERKQLPEAVRFICTFKLIDKLPPTPLLKEYVEDAKNYFEVLCRMSIALDEKVFSFSFFGHPVLAS